MVGAWLETSHQQTSDVHGDDTLFTGKGATQVYRGDGSHLIDWGAGIALTGWQGGARWEWIINGRQTYHYQTRAGAIHLSTSAATGTVVAKRNGVVKYRGPLRPGLKPPLTYTCQGDSLRLYREGLAIQLTRVKQGV